MWFKLAWFKLHYKKKVWMKPCFQWFDKWTKKLTLFFPRNKIFDKISCWSPPPPPTLVFFLGFKANLLPPIWSTLIGCCFVSAFLSFAYHFKIWHFFFWAGDYDHHFKTILKKNLTPCSPVDFWTVLGWFFFVCRQFINTMKIG